MSGERDVGSRPARDPDGKDAVVIVAAKQEDREREHRAGHRLVEALASSPLRDLDFEREDVAGPVRDVEIWAASSSTPT